MRFGIITDAHLADPEKTATAWHNAIDFARSEPLLELAVRFVRDANVDAVMFLGDLVHDGDDASLRRGLDLLAVAELPVWIVPGNHDGEAAWSAAIAGAGLTGENGCDPGIAIYPVVEFHLRADGEVWDAGLPDLVGGPAVVLSHAPVLDCEPTLNAATLRFAGGFAWSDSAGALAERVQPLLVLHGHLHVRMELVAGPVLQLGFAALIEAPHAVAILDIENTGAEVTVSVSHHSVAEYDVAVVPVLSPAVSRWIARDGAWMLALD